MNPVNKALRRAAAQGREEDFKALLLHPDADTMEGDRDGMTMLMVASSFGQASIAGLLIPLSDAAARSRDGSTALMQAASSGNASCVEILLTISDALARDEDGWTALMCAAITGQWSCTQALLPSSDVLAKDLEGKTARDHAADQGHTQVASLIDAHTLSMSEARTLHAEAFSGSAHKTTSLRV